MKYSYESKTGKQYSFDSILERDCAAINDYLEQDGISLNYLRDQIKKPILIFVEEGEYFGGDKETKISIPTTIISSIFLGFNITFSNQLEMFIETGDFYIHGAIERCYRDHHLVKSEGDGIYYIKDNDGFLYLQLSVKDDFWRIKIQIQFSDGKLFP